MRIVAYTAAATFLIDQASKYAVVHGLQLDLRRAIDVWPPYLQFRMAWNQGINFGLFANAEDAVRWILITLALAISVWVWVWVRRQPHSPITLFSAGLLIGGALGNVVDRIFYGAVADFLNMSCCGINNPYSFNVADIAVFIGAFGLVLFTGREKTP